MAREVNPNRKKALEIYLENDGKIENRAIASTLNENEKTISVWKIRDKWSQILPSSTSKNECSTSEKSVVLQKSTTNKIIDLEKKNRKNSGAPKGNKNNYKHGLYSIMFNNSLPEEIKYIFEESFNTDEQLALDIKLCSINIFKLQSLLNNVLSDDKSSLTQESKYDLSIRISSEINRTINTKNRLISTLSSTEYKAVKLDFDLMKFELEKVLNNKIEPLEEENSLIKALNQTNPWNEDEV